MKITIKQQLKTGNYTKHELVEWLNKYSCGIMFDIVTVIISNNMHDEIIVDTLFEMRKNLNSNFKYVGYYKTGHLAMYTLIKLGFSEEDVFEGIDDYEKRYVRILFYSL